MSMVNGALIPAADGNFVAYDVNVTAGYGLGFMVTDPGSDEPGAEIYCIQVCCTLHTAFENAAQRVLF